MAQKPSNLNQYNTKTHVCINSKSDFFNIHNFYQNCFFSLLKTFHGTQAIKSKPINHKNISLTSCSLSMTHKTHENNINTCHLYDIFIRNCEFA